MEWKLRLLVVGWTIGLSMAQSCPDLAGVAVGCVFGTLAVVGVIAAIVALVLWKRRKAKAAVPVKPAPGAKDNKHAYDNPMFQDDSAVEAKDTSAQDAEKGFVGYVECKEFESPKKREPPKASPAKVPQSSNGLPKKTWSSLPNNQFTSMDTTFGGHKFGSRGSLDNTFLSMDSEVVEVALQSQDIIGLGFNITGSMRDGIFVSQVHHRGPASETGKIEAGDRILAVTISFENMVYEDALTILSYASPYPVKVTLQKEEQKSPRSPLKDINLNLHHPIYRSQSMDDLTKIGKDSAFKAKRHYSEMRSETRTPKINKEQLRSLDLPETIETQVIVETIGESSTDFVEVSLDDTGVVEGMDLPSLPLGPPPVPAANVLPESMTEVSELRTISPPQVVLQKTEEVSVIETSFVTSELQEIRGNDIVPEVVIKASDDLATESAIAPVAVATLKEDVERIGDTSLDVSLKTDIENTTDKADGTEITNPDLSKSDLGNFNFPDLQLDTSDFLSEVNQYFDKEKGEGKTDEVDGKAVAPSIGMGTDVNIKTNISTESTLDLEAAPPAVPAALPPSGLDTNSDFADVFKGLDLQDKKDLIALSFENPPVDAVDAKAKDIGAEVKAEASNLVEEVKVDVTESTMSALHLSSGNDGSLPTPPKRGKRKSPDVPESLQMESTLGTYSTQDLAEKVGESTDVSVKVPQVSVSTDSGLDDSDDRIPSVISDSLKMDIPNEKINADFSVPSIEVEKVEQNYTDATELKNALKGEILQDMNENKVLVAEGALYDLAVKTEGNPVERNFPEERKEIAQELVTPIVSTATENAPPAFGKLHGDFENESKLALNLEASVPEIGSSQGDSLGLSKGTAQPSMVMREEPNIPVESLSFEGSNLGSPERTVPLKMVGGEENSKVSAVLADYFADRPAFWGKDEDSNGKPIVVRTERTETTTGPEGLRTERKTVKEELVGGYREATRSPPVLTEPGKVTRSDSYGLRQPASMGDPAMDDYSAMIQRKVDRIRAVQEELKAMRERPPSPDDEPFLSEFMGMSRRGQNAVGFRGRLSPPDSPPRSRAPDPPTPEIKRKATGGVAFGVYFDDDADEPVPPKRRIRPTEDLTYDLYNAGEQPLRATPVRIVPDAVQNRKDVYVLDVQSNPQEDSPDSRLTSSTQSYTSSQAAFDVAPGLIPVAIDAPTQNGRFSAESTPSTSPTKTQLQDLPQGRLHLLDDTSDKVKRSETIQTIESVITTDQLPSGAFTMTLDGARMSSSDS